MRLNSRAKKLAVILLQSAKESNKAQEVHVSLKKIILLLRKDARFRLLLLSKRISTEKKTTILRNATYFSLLVQAYPLADLATVSRMP